MSAQYAVKLRTRSRRSLASDVAVWWIESLDGMAWVASKGGSEWGAEEVGDILDVGALARCELVCLSGSFGTCCVEGSRARWG